MYRCYECMCDRYEDQHFPSCTKFKMGAAAELLARPLTLRDLYSVKEDLSRITGLEAQKGLLERLITQVRKER